MDRKGIKSPSTRRKQNVKNKKRKRGGKSRGKGGGGGVLGRCERLFHERTRNEK